MTKRSIVTRIKTPKYESLQWGVVIEENGEHFVYFLSPSGKHTAEVVNRSVQPQIGYVDTTVLAKADKVYSRTGMSYYKTRTTV